MPPPAAPPQDGDPQHGDARGDDARGDDAQGRDAPDGDAYVLALGRLFRDNPVWARAMGCIAIGVASNVYFTHLPQQAWRFVKAAEGVDLVPGRADAPDFVFRFTPGAVVALASAAGSADAVAVTLFDLMLDPDSARHVDFRIVASYATLVRHGHVRLLVTSGPKVLAYGAAHGIRTPGQLRELVRNLRRRAPADWEI